MANHDFVTDLQDKLRTTFETEEQRDKFIQEIVDAIESDDGDQLGSSAANLSSKGPFKGWRPGNPLRDLNRQARCALCVTAVAATAAAIAAWAASNGGIGVVLVQQTVVTQFGVSSTVAHQVAAAVVAGASAGAIARAMCPDCR